MNNHTHVITEQDQHLLEQLWYRGCVQPQIFRLNYIKYRRECQY